MVAAHKDPFLSKVQDLWHQNTENWNIELVNQIFDHQAAQIISATQWWALLQRTFLFGNLKKGLCTSKEAYKIICPPTPTTTNMQGSRRMITEALNLLNGAWKDANLQPKLKTFLWRLLSNRLTQEQQR